MTMEELLLKAAARIDELTIEEKSPGELVQLVDDDELSAGLRVLAEKHKAHQ